MIQFLNIAGLGPIFGAILGAMYLFRENKFHWPLSVPALIMTAVCITYFLVAPHKAGGLSLGTDTGYPLGAVLALAIAVFWYITVKRKQK